MVQKRSFDVYLASSKATSFTIHLITTQRIFITVIVYEII